MLLAASSAPNAAAFSEAMRNGGLMANVPGVIELLTWEVFELVPHATIRAVSTTTPRGLNNLIMRVSLLLRKRYTSVRRAFFIRSVLLYYGCQPVSRRFYASRGIRQCADIDGGMGWSRG